MQRAIVVMGVAGSGKTAVGAALAAERGAPFLEGDALHPASNIRKMSAGIPLTDADRRPWLAAIAARIAAEPAPELVVTCSALRRAYREQLRGAGGRPLVFLYLHGAPELLAARIGDRTGHFMPAGMLASQLATLEDPTGEPGVVRVEIDATVAEIVAQAQAALPPAGPRPG